MGATRCAAIGAMAEDGAPGSVEAAAGDAGATRSEEKVPWGAETGPGESAKGAVGPAIGPAEAADDAGEGEEDRAR